MQRFEERYERFQNGRYGQSEEKVVLLVESVIQQAVALREGEMKYKFEYLG